MILLPDRFQEAANVAIMKAQTLPPGRPLLGISPYGYTHASQYQPRRSEAEHQPVNCDFSRPLTEERHDYLYIVIVSQGKVLRPASGTCDALCQEWFLVLQFAALLRLHELNAARQPPGRSLLAAP